MDDLDGLRPVVTAIDYVRILRARIGVLLLVAFLILGGVVLASVLTPARYATHAVVYFSVPPTDTTSNLNRGLAYANALVRSYAEAATTPRVLDPVIAKLHLRRTSSELAQSVRARAPIGTIIIEVWASDPSPRQAAAIADGVAQQIATSVQDLTPATPSSVEGIQVLTVARADVPLGPATPRTGLNVILALVLGPLVAVVVCVWLERVNPRVLNAADVNYLDGLPLLGFLPVGARRRFRWFRKRREAALRSLLVSFAAGFRGLEQTRPLRTLLFVAPVRDSAALHAVAAVGGIMRVEGVRVVVIDANLRRSSSARQSEGEPLPGLSSVLRGDCSWRDVVQEAPHRPAFISTGTAFGDPPLRLDSAALRDLFADLQTEFERILICAAPVLRSGDALELAQAVDGVLLVGDERYPTRRDLRAALRALRTVRAPVRALVLNH